MTNLEQYFIDTVTMLDDIGADYFIHGSTLLGKVRNNCLLERENLHHDRELNFGMLVEDFTPKIYFELAKRNKFFKSMGKRLPNALNYFSTNEEQKDMWAIPEFSLLTLYWRGKTKWFEYMGGETGMIWDRKYLDDKSKWETIELLGKKVKTPYMKEQFLADYFGKDYMTEKRIWHYDWGACNKTTVLNLINEQELIL